MQNAKYASAAAPCVRAPQPAPPQPRAACAPAPSRREALSLCVALSAAAVLQPPPAAAAGRTRTKAPPEEEYVALPVRRRSLLALLARITPPQPFTWRGEEHAGLRIADLVVGSGKAVALGSVLSARARSLARRRRSPAAFFIAGALRLQVPRRGRRLVPRRPLAGSVFPIFFPHFFFSRTLPGGNRTLAEAFSVKYGALPEEFTRPRRKQSFVGVGVELRPAEPGSSDEGLFIVSSTRAGGPAAQAGVRPLDRLLALDGVSVAQLSLGEVARRLADGPPGSSVTLRLRQSRSESGPFESNVTLERALLALPPRAAAASDGPAGGLYAGSGSGPKPPPALFLAVQGMREGGRRSVLVPADVGYDDLGSNEIPPGAAFVMEVEVLSVAEPKPAA